MSSIAIKSCKQSLLITSNTYYTKLENQNVKLKTENKLLQVKNMILTENCHEYTSHNERQNMAHQLEIDLVGAPIKDLQIKIETLEQINNTLTNKCSALQRNISDYERKNDELLRIHVQFDHVKQQLSQAKIQIKTLQDEKSVITIELDTFKSEMTSQERVVADLRYKLEKKYDVFERRSRRKSETALRMIETSESIQPAFLSPSSLYSPSGGKAMFYTHRTHKPPTPMTRTPSVSSIGNSIKALIKRQNVKKRWNTRFQFPLPVETAVSSSGYGDTYTSDTEDQGVHFEHTITDDDSHAFWEYVALGSQRLKEDTMDNLSVLEFADFPHKLREDTISPRRSISSTIATPNYGYNH
eukprot:56465_1